MSNVQLKPELILGAINSNLNLHFFLEPRDIAKTLFNDLADGKSAPFMKFEIGKKAEIHCNLELDASEYVGKLNYGKFRKSVALMMLSIQRMLEDKNDLSKISMTNETGELLFNIPGILHADDQINILVCGFRQQAPGLACASLMYLEPEFYAQAAGLTLDDIKKGTPVHDTA